MTGVSAISNIAAATGIVTSDLVLHLDAANVASYPGTGTTWTDLSVSGSNGTLVGGPTYSSANSGSLVFDGSSAYIDMGIVSAVNAATNFTVSMWFKTSNISREQVLFATINPTLTSGWHVEFYQSKFMMQVYPSGQYAQATNAMSSDLWYNVVVAYTSGGGVAYYQNGAANGTTTGKTFATPVSTTIIARFGQYYAPYAFVGNIAQVLFYNRTLSASEILANYDALRGRFGL